MATNAKNGEGQIDEDLHSRQLAVYGRESMAKMAQVREAPSTQPCHAHWASHPLCPWRSRARNRPRSAPRPGCRRAFWCAV